MSSEELHADEALSDEYIYEDLFSVFEKPNLVLKVGNKKLHVKKEQLMEQSVVFEKMFYSDFKEAKADEIQLPGKDPTTFCRFLRLLLPGFDDELEEDLVRDILPLVREYQADSLMGRIDTRLRYFTKKNGNDIRTDSIIQNILEAEQYDMPNYLNACIDVASRKIHKRLTSNIQFSEVTQNTRSKICMRRISKIDSIYEKERPKIRIGIPFNYKESKESIAVKHFQPYMMDN